MVVWADQKIHTAAKRKSKSNEWQNKVPNPNKGGKYQRIFSFSLNIQRYEQKSSQPFLNLEYSHFIYIHSFIK